MEINILVSIKMEKHMEKESIYGIMVRFMMENGEVA